MHVAVGGNGSFIVIGRECHRSESLPDIANFFSRKRELSLGVVALHHLISRTDHVMHVTRLQISFSIVKLKPTDLQIVLYSRQSETTAHEVSGHNSYTLPL